MPRRRLASPRLSQGERAERADVLNRQIMLKTIESLQPWQGPRSEGVRYAQLQCENREC